MPVANIASAPCHSSVERPNAVTLNASHVNDTETSRARPRVTLNDETNGVATTAPMPNAAVSRPRPAAPAPNTLSAKTAAQLQHRVREERDGEHEHDGR